MEPTCLSVRQQQHTLNACPCHAVTIETFHPFRDDRKRVSPVSPSVRWDWDVSWLTWLHFSLPVEHKSQTTCLDPDLLPLQSSSSCTWNLLCPFLQISFSRLSLPHWCKKNVFYVFYLFIKTRKNAFLTFLILQRFLLIKTLTIVTCQLANYVLEILGER